MRRALLAALGLLLAACVSPGAREPERFHVLEAQGAPPQAKAVRPATLVVTSSAASFYETRAMAYSREPGTRAYYQYNRWTEPPSQRFGALLIAWLEASGGFQAVASARTALTRTAILSVHIEDFYHDAAQPPGQARVALVAEISDPETRQLLGRETFRRAAPAPTFDASGAASAFRAATGAVLQDLVAWVNQNAALAQRATAAPH